MIKGIFLILFSNWTKSQCVVTEQTSFHFIHFKANLLNAVKHCDLIKCKTTNHNSFIILHFHKQKSHVFSLSPMNKWWDDPELWKGKSRPDVCLCCSQTFYRAWNCFFSSHCQDRFWSDRDVREWRRMNKKRQSADELTHDGRESVELLDLRIFF